MGHWAGHCSTLLVDDQKHAGAKWEGRPDVSVNWLKRGLFCVWKLDDALMMRRRKHRLAFDAALHAGCFAGGTPTTTRYVGAMRLLPTGSWNTSVR